MACTAPNGSPAFRLVEPQPQFQVSFLAAVDEYAADGATPAEAGLLDWPAEGAFPGRSYSREDLTDPVLFADFANFTWSQRLIDSPRPRGFVPATTLWMIADERFVGRVSLRHSLTEFLREVGGHIGYSVRPSARRRGYATRALTAMMRVAVDHGIDPVLVTCDVDNEASRRVIESNGGRLKDQRNGKLRFWVPGPAGP